MPLTTADLTQAETPAPGLVFKPLNRKDVANILDVSVRTVENWRREGRIPQPVEIGGRVYWHPGVFYAGLANILGANGPLPDEGPELPKVVVQQAKRALEPSGALAKARKKSQALIDGMTSGNE
jgi:hypothetical protein